MPDPRDPFHRPTPTPGSGPPGAGGPAAGGSAAGGSGPGGPQSGSGRPGAGDAGDDAIRALLARAVAQAPAAPTAAEIGR
ncbi:MAG TPA: hypothetical protein VGO78_03105, partial [Acidimicrobiales bacterium]|nr:hypothetical protein [Acidimicrobiales bacterium]